MKKFILELLARRNLNFVDFMSIMWFTTLVGDGEWLIGFGQLILGGVLSYVLERWLERLDA